MEQLLPASPRSPRDPQEPVSKSGCAQDSTAPGNPTRLAEPSHLQTSQLNIVSSRILEVRVPN